MALEKRKKEFKSFLLNEKRRTENTVNAYLSGVNTVSKHYGKEVFSIIDLGELDKIWTDYGPGGKYKNVGDQNSGSTRSGLRDWIEFQKNTFQDNSNSYFVELTDGAIRNGYIVVRDNNGFFPPEFIANEKGISESQFTLCWPDGEERLTCVLSKFGRIKARFNRRFADYTAPVTLCITKDSERKDRFHISKQSPKTSIVSMDGKNMKDDEKLGYGQPLNQILYGPPGTGKTYSTTHLSVLLADPNWFEELQSQGLDEDQERASIKARYEELCSDGRILLTTFHQSFSYEDFVEGIRAKTSKETKTLEYKVEDGVFKRMCDRAVKAVSTHQDIGLSESPDIWKISIGRTNEKEMRDKYIEAGEARIGWNDTGDLSLEWDDRTHEQQEYWDKELSSRNRTAISAFSHEMKVGDVLLCLKNAETVQAIGVVESDYYFDEAECNKGYAHARKVSWLLKNIELNILPLNSDTRMVQQTVYPLNRINWNSLVTELEKQQIELPVSLNPETSNSTVQNYVLIIDEINRGNISRIFGELITLLEPDKRKGGSDARSVILPYSKEPFNVPSNLYVVGTMNTADKSLAQLDLALRRRFEFAELMPEPTLLSGISVHGVDIGELLDLLNQRIEVLLDRDHMLGHAYFWPLKGVDSEGEKEMLLADIFAKRVIPLLQEYFFADWERIGWVLNDPGKDPDAQFIQTEAVGQPLSHLFSNAIADEVIDRRYRINQQAFTNPDSYKRIFNVVGE
ncbi:ATPase [Photobacterium aquimaris]|uniref:ATPase n=1 Tax=Photobacterium aquimaris TaxID=512643 RepID=A0A2T3IEL7_9GAMM|nr:AAA family ATPase [Photobacterium aquimaris]OBU20005.1 hypothetical protein AYY20_16880 [Photobacterium aquimaris]PSU22781.1 ATPase [Photobacterium aquimaris]